MEDEDVVLVEDERELRVGPQGVELDEVTCQRERPRVVEDPPRPVMPDQSINGLVASRGVDVRCDVLAFLIFARLDLERE